MKICFKKRIKNGLFFGLVFGEKAWTDKAILPTKITDDFELAVIENMKTNQHVKEATMVPDGK